jgi:hypothetical protein
MRQMKVVVRNSLTKKFWTDRGNWSRNPGRAHDFTTSSMALKHCYQTGLYQFEVLFQNAPETDNAHSIRSDTS